MIVWSWLTNMWLCLCLPAVCKQVVLRYVISWCDLALKNEQERGSFSRIFLCFLVLVWHWEAQAAWNWGSPIAVSITLHIWFLLPGKFLGSLTYWKVWARFQGASKSRISACSSTLPALQKQLKQDKTGRAERRCTVHTCVCLWRNPSPLCVLMFLRLAWSGEMLCFCELWFLHLWRTERFRIRRAC